MTLCVCVEGLWTVARKTILHQVAYRFEQFKHEGFVLFDSIKPNGYQYSKFRYLVGSREERYLHVLNVHLLPMEGALLDSCPVNHNRRLELAQLVDAVRFIPPADAWLILGDFNLDPKRDAAMLGAFVHALQGLVKASERIDRAGPDNLDSEVGKKRKSGQDIALGKQADFQKSVYIFQPDIPTLSHSASYRSAFVTNLAVDHMYSNRPLRQARVLDNEISDHFAIAADLEL
jgi:endonuclease/exonuclease/phosphatase family metal-dependent hydrolase